MNGNPGMRDLQFFDSKDFVACITACADYNSRLPSDNNVREKLCSGVSVRDNSCWWKQNITWGFSSLKPESSMNSAILWTFNGVR